MVSDFNNHRIAYFFLIVILFIFVLLFLGAWPNREVQRLLALSISLFYFIWGVIVHVRIGYINKRIIFEYLSISLLAGSILTLLTFQT